MASGMQGPVGYIPTGLGYGTTGYEWLSQPAMSALLSNEVVIPFTTSQTPTERSTMINAYIQTYKGKAKLLVPPHPSGPTTEWEILTPALVDDYTYLAAQVWGACGLKLADGAEASANVITNILNTATEHTTPNHHIVIEGLRVNGNGNRASHPGSAGDSTVSCCIGLACVEYVIVRGNYAYEPYWKHCIDVAASIYPINSGNPAIDYNYPQGPSLYVDVYENLCSNGNDDCITTHGGCGFINIFRNICLKTWDRTLDADNSNGIEIDEGSGNIGLINVYDNYIRGNAHMARGIEVKGHSDTPAAQNVNVIGNTIYGVAIGVCIRHLSHDNATPSTTAKNVTIAFNYIDDIGEFAVALGISPNAIEVQAYTNYKVFNNTCLNTNDTWPAGYEVIFSFSGANNGWYKDNYINGFPTADYGIRISSSAGVNHTVMHNTLIDLGLVAGISLNVTGLIVGGNRISFPTGGSTGGGLIIGSAAQLVFNLPDQISGFTTVMQVGSISYAASTQIVNNGGDVTTYDHGTITSNLVIDTTLRPQQILTANAAFVLSADTTKLGWTTLTTTNGASAGTITFTFSVVRGDAYVTTVGISYGCVIATYPGGFSSIDLTRLN